QAVVAAVVPDVDADPHRGVALREGAGVAGLVERVARRHRRSGAVAVAVAHVVAGAGVAVVAGRAGRGGGVDADLRARVAGGRAHVARGGAARVAALPGG